MDQQTQAWKDARVGCVTASKMADLLARTKSGAAASRANYMAQLIAERLTEKPTEGYTNAAMQWGLDTEPQARDAYCFRTDANVTEVGFILHPTIPMSGASPDGTVDPDGLVEIKCPGTANHIDALLSGTVEGKYVHQMNWQMACTGRKWCDFVSFDPRLPESMRLFVKRIERDDAVIADMEKNVREFLAELDAKVTALKARFG